MKRLLLFMVMLMVMVMVAACGDDTATSPDAALAPDADLAPDATVTGTLSVNGSCVVNNPENQTAGTVLRVSCELRVTRAGVPVPNAIIQFNPAPPAFQTVLVGEALDPSHYVGTYMGYFDTAKLTISTPEDETGELLVRGPKLFVVEQPQPGILLPTAAPLHVSWSKPEGSVDSADVALASGFLVEDLPDPGVYDVPAAELVPSSLDEVQVTRWRVNPLAPGAAPGSVLEFGVRSSQAFQVL